MHPLRRIAGLSLIDSVAVQASEAAGALKLVEMRVKGEMDAADRAAAELLQEEEHASQAAQRSKQKVAAKKARQKQRKQVLSRSGLEKHARWARLPSSHQSCSSQSAACYEVPGG